jgi:uncharacterized protein
MSALTDIPFLLDVNVLLALALDTHHRHVSANRWLAGVGAWATTPLTESGFVRLLCNVNVSGYEISLNSALAAVTGMRALDAHHFLADDSSLASPHLDLGTLVGPKQVTDFHLVNLAAQHSVQLATFDASLVRSLAAADRHHVHLIEW